MPDLYLSLSSLSWSFPTYRRHNFFWYLATIWIQCNRLPSLPICLWRRPWTPLYRRRRSGFGRTGLHSNTQSPSWSHLACPLVIDWRNPTYNSRKSSASRKRRTKGNKHLYQGLCNKRVPCSWNRLIRSTKWTSRTRRLPANQVLGSKSCATSRRFRLNSLRRTNCRSSSSCTTKRLRRRVLGQMRLDGRLERRLISFAGFFLKHMF